MQKLDLFLGKLLHRTQYLIFSADRLRTYQRNLLKLVNEVDLLDESSFRRFAKSQIFYAGKSILQLIPTGLNCSPTILPHLSGKKG